MDEFALPAPALKSGVNHADALILYGVKLNGEQDYASMSVNPGQTIKQHLRIGMYRAGLKDGEPLKSSEYSIALAYGYAYDGHCYRFDSLRTFIVTDSKAESAVGCGFDALQNAKYSMWRIRSSSQLLEIAINFGDVKSLILDANLPGKKSPSAYAINVRMGHRGA